MDHEQTIKEAHALLRSGHLPDAIAVLAGAVNSMPPVKVEAGDPCADENEPEWMCKECGCWKQTRALCS
jgi:hypothetical protein